MKKECEVILKKEYEAPNVEVTLLETNEGTLQTTGSMEDPIEDDD